jgi:hypothetical protein
MDLLKSISPLFWRPETAQASQLCELFVKQPFFSKNPLALWAKMM